MALSLCKMRAHDRAVQPPAQPRLVACLGLIARLQLLLQLPHQHVHLRSFWTACIALASKRLCGVVSGKVSKVCVLTKMVKKWGVLEFFFLEW